ncbi:TetR/AcrR family transcriptional regulator [Streptomyces anulatus]|uniref:TetR/AcrR family transcriptional regulator n=1 Tax=Streptomyces TaxID=1883 RepID=UPI001B376B69|nr:MULTISPECIES: TetR/AcrR family transcriptional regulator [unclassified Streptomyces]MBQ1106985.1 TetR/AcrR family transcriptional regulator [Streptomyces sp. 404i]MBQ1115146.1 TetR/AcrR family transcriptional regulator [Streptomyces sp. C3-3]
MTPSTSGRDLRADARLNREQIIEAARELFAERGPDVPTEEVARRAGVGTGTLYRRFPDRQALISAVALDGFHRVVAIARTAEDEEPDAWRALTRFVHRARTELRLATWLSVWFASTWAELQEDPENHRLRQILLKILDRLVRRAQSDGDMRPDVDTGDLALLIALLLRPVPGLRAELTQRSADRSLALMLDSLRARDDNQRLPHQGISIADLDPRS